MKNPTPRQAGGKLKKSYCTRAKGIKRRPVLPGHAEHGFFDGDIFHLKCQEAEETPAKSNRPAFPEYL
jgi:hypothetical protein